MRLIDGDALEKEGWSLHRTIRVDKNTEEYQSKPLRQVPTIEPQRTGRWIDHAEEGYVECPFCHSATNCDDNILELHFCFSCGARMEGEQE